MTIRIIPKLRDKRFAAQIVRFSNAGLTHLPDCPEASGSGGDTPHIPTHLSLVHTS